MTEDMSDGDQRSKKRTKTAQTTTRSPVACSRCRRQKLRCSGGHPCQRCQKLGLSNECSFPGPRGATALSPADRLNQLESAVLSLRQVIGGQEDGVYQPGLPGPSQQQGTAVSRPSESFPSMMSPASQATSSCPPITPSDAWTAPSPRPVHQLQQPVYIGAASSEQHRAPMSFASSEMPKDSVTGLTPQPLSTSAVALPDSWIPGANPTSGPLAHPSSASSATPRPTATDGDRCQAPFGDVVFNKSVYENREISRLPSPAPQMEPRLPGNDVVEVGIISIQMATYYYGLFIQHCLPFIPIFPDGPPPSLNTLRARSSFLSTVCITLGARIAPSRGASTSEHGEELSLYEALADHSDLCLGSTLTRKILVLEDVKATLLMAGWGLRPNGEGADAWIVSGHALRMAKRLGLDVPRAGVYHHRAKERERVWLLACVFECYHTLGFGRPGVFFQRPSQSPSISQDPTPNSSAETFITCQAELVGICHDLVQWVDEWRKAGVPPLPGNLLWAQLAPRLDEWSAKWVWPSSRFVCASTHISRLYGEHIRLCLALFVLKTITRDGSGADGPKLSNIVSTAVKAATVITQIATDSGNTDEAISFAPDYNILSLAQAGLAIISLSRPTSDASDPLCDGLHPSEAADIAEARPDENAAVYLLKALTSSLARKDRSKTGLATFLSKKLQNAAAAAGLHLDGSRSKESTSARAWNPRPIQNGERASFDVGSQPLPETAAIESNSLIPQMDSNWNDVLDPFFFFDPTLANLWYGYAVQRPEPRHPPLVPALLPEQHKMTASHGEVVGHEPPTTQMSGLGYDGCRSGQQFAINGASPDPLVANKSDGGSHSCSERMFILVPPYPL